MKTLIHKASQMFNSTQVVCLRIQWSHLPINLVLSAISRFVTVSLQAPIPHLDHQQAVPVVPAVPQDHGTIMDLPAALPQLDHQQLQPLDPHPQVMLLGAQAMHYK